MNLGLIHLYWIFYNLWPNIPTLAETYEPKPTLGNPMGYTVHGILQARILKWVAFPLSSGFPNPAIKLGLLYCKRILYQLSYQGSLKVTRGENFISGIFQAGKKKLLQGNLYFTTHLQKYYVIIFFRPSSWTIDLIPVLQVRNSDSESLNNLPYTKDLVNITTEPQIPTL